MRNLWIYLLFFFLSAGMIEPKPVFAQDQNQLQSWNKFYAIFRINEELNCYTDYGFRLSFPASEFFRVHIRPTIEIPLIRDRFYMHVGMGFFLVWQQSLPSTYEFRPYFGYYYDAPPLWIFNLKGRFRYEERFINSIESSELTPSLRLRYKFYVTIPFSRTDPQLKKWEGITTFEFFDNIGNVELEQFVDQTRTEVGLGHTFTKNFKVALVYLYQTSQGIRTHVIRWKFYFTYGSLADE